MPGRALNVAYIVKIFIFFSFLFGVGVHRVYLTIFVMQNEIRVKIRPELVAVELNIKIEGKIVKL